MLCLWQALVIWMQSRAVMESLPYPLRESIASAINAGLFSKVLSQCSKQRDFVTWNVDFFGHQTCWVKPDRTQTTQLPIFSRIPDTDNLKARFTAALIRRMSSAFYLSGSLITRWNCIKTDTKIILCVIKIWKLCSPQNAFKCECTSRKMIHEIYFIDDSKCIVIVIMGRMVVEWGSGL